MDQLQPTDWAWATLTDDHQLITDDGRRLEMAPTALAAGGVPRAHPGQRLHVGLEHDKVVCARWGDSPITVWK